MVAQHLRWCSLPCSLEGVADIPRRGSLTLRLLHGVSPVREGQLDGGRGVRGGVKVGSNVYLTPSFSRK